MKRFLYRSFALMASIIGATSLQAGTLFYVPIPASDSDSNSGISSDNTYTTAVDGGNGQGTDRVINGITLYALTGDGQSFSANNCFLNVLEGSVANGGGSSQSIQADGTLGEVASDMTFNNEAGDGSKQEIVLDPASLAAGTTYELRVYICNPSGQKREVNLTFAGDGQEPVETGWFNEDDATTSAGGFQDANQVYYIDYRYTWDGDTTPGITIEQRYGRTPFCLYALTNQVVPGEETGEQATAEATSEAVTSEAAAPEVEEGGVSTGYVGASSDDQVGVTSDTFYTDESLNSNGEWVDVASYGKCWRPTRVSADWRPYTNGRWGDCGECGWTWISDEDWGWCTYHYGRWCRVQGTGWCWAPGTVWAPAWVSWRRGTGSDCSCVGWAPLPPEARCAINVGVGNWIDRTCGIGPDAYTFVNVVDFGSDNFSRCGRCLIDRGRYVNVFQQTTNVTNISYVNIVNKTNKKYVNIYNGGPDRTWVNNQIRRQGGKEISQIHINRYDDPAKIKGGKRAQLEGNTLSLVAPKITPTKTPQHAPKIAATIPRNKIDKGWNGVKDPKVKRDLDNKIAQQTKGQNPKNAPAKLPPNVATQLAKGTGAGGRAGQLKNLPKGAVVQQGRPGQLNTKKGPPRRPGQLITQEQSAAGGKPGGGNVDARNGLAAPPKMQAGGRPGQKVGQKGSATKSGNQGATGGNQGLASQGGMRPGQSLKKAAHGPTKLSPQKNVGQETGQGAQNQGAQAAKSGIQGKGASQIQTPQGKQGGNLPAARSTTGGAGPQAKKPVQSAQTEENGARKQEALRKQEQQRQMQAEQEKKSQQQKQAQLQRANAEHQQRAAAQEKEKLQQQQIQQRKQQQQAEQEKLAEKRAQLQQQQAQQRQKQIEQQQAQQRQKQLQQQEAQERQGQLQQQQAQQRQRALRQQQAQQQQALQRQRQLQQQQAQQQQKPPPKGKATPTPTPR